MKDTKLTLVFVVGGEDVAVEINPNAPLKAALEKALAKSGNTGRPPNDWEVTDEGGSVLDPSTKVEDLGLQDGARLFLTPKVSKGGAACYAC
jgi:hypothetical protein